MKHIYLLLFTLAFSLSARAQTDFKPGYITKADSSRTDGLIDYRGTNAKAALLVTFKASETSPETIYQPSEILGYSLADGKQFESITIKATDNTSQIYFMEVLAKGAATLYFMKYDDIKERFFVTTNDGRIHELIQEQRRVDDGKGNVYNATLKHYVGTLTTVLEACPDVKTNISKARLEKSDLIRLVNKYNVCVAPEEVKIAMNASENKTKVEKMIVLGGALTNATFNSGSYSDEYAVKGDINPSINLTAGIVVNIMASKLSEKLSLNTGIMYHQYRIEGEHRQNFAGGAYYEYDFFVEAKHLKVPFVIRYTWPKGKVRTFINAGVQGGYLLDADSNVKRYGKFGSQELNHEFKMMPSYRKLELGFIGGIGLKTEAFGNRTITLEARHEKNHGLSEGAGFIHTNYISSILLGIAF